MRWHFYPKYIFHHFCTSINLSGRVQTVALGLLWQQLYHCALALLPPKHFFTIFALQLTEPVELKPLPSGSWDKCSTTVHWHFSLQYFFHYFRTSINLSGRVQTLALRLMRQAFYHCALALLPPKHFFTIFALQLTEPVELKPLPSGWWDKCSTTVHWHFCIQYIYSLFSNFNLRGDGWTQTLGLG